MIKIEFKYDRQINLPIGGFMKVVKLLLCVVCILIISPSVMAFQNEPDGLRGMKWGDKISTDAFKESEKYLWDCGTQFIALTYVKEKEELSFGDFKVEAIYWCAYEEKLVAAVIMSDSRGGPRNSDSRIRCKIYD
ncbi:MAG: hypothetical protein HY809_06190 [Nitrospirae bacterium]|nr:hypothetical protein [Nitrospirota bacterium]